MTSPLFVGVDGGGTKTKVTVLGSSQQLLAEELGGSTNPNSVGNEKAASNLKDVIVRAVFAAQSKLSQPHNVADVRSIVLSLAGVDRAEDIKKVTGWVREFLPNEATAVAIYNDAVAALASGTGGNLSGIVSISGTGTICYGRNAAGQEARAFGFGALTDMGSGFQLGISALKAVWAAHDGSGPHTSILKGVQDHIGLKTIDELIPWTYSDLSWARIASLAPVVFHSAQQGDKVAQSILEETSDYLSKGIVVVARKLGFAAAADAAEAKSQPVTIVLAGSINAQPEVADLVKKKVLATLPQANLVHPTVDSAMGAALLAANSAKHNVAGVV